MNVDWEDDHLMYEDDTRRVYWRDFVGGLILLSILFFTCYGVVSFIKDFV